MNYTCVDAFCGAGGLSLGLQMAGLNVIYSFDMDEVCYRTRVINSKYFSHKTEKLSIDDLLSDKKRLNFGLGASKLFLLAGGPPCQGFSIQRIGDDNDTRNTLVDKYFDLIKRLSPHYFLMENVPGIKGKRGRHIFKGFIERAQKMGYITHIGEMDAQDFNVPQRRRRVFIVGESEADGLANFIFPVPITPKGGRRTVRQTIGHLPPPPEDGSDHPKIANHRRDKLSDKNKERLKYLKQGQGRDYLPLRLLADCHKVSSDIIGHRNVYGRMVWDDVAPTITARFDSFTRGKFGHPDQLRSISLREGALLQTFPKDFVFCGSKVDVARQIGNAVPPLMAKAMGLQIIKCYQRKTGGRI